MRAVRYSLAVFCLVTLHLLLLVGCRPANTHQTTVTIVHDGVSQVIALGTQTSVSDVLRSAGIELGGLDRVNPPGYSRVVDGMTITVVRVTEELVVVQEEVAFERQTVPNDSLPTGETRLIQPGVNGTAEITYRITYEDGVETARSQVRRVLISPPKSEVVMVGSQGQLPTVTVVGNLAYISGGNAWIMSQNSTNRRPLTVDGGVDGRVFALSTDGKRLLFTKSGASTSSGSGQERSSTETAGNGTINTLWVVLDIAVDSEPLRLDVDNILFADWLPGSERTIVYSTAEPRASYPGWQANNDLWVAQISANGAVARPRLILEPSSGGIYGWYGTLFSFSPDGETIAWAQADALGILRPEDPPDAAVNPTVTPAAREAVNDEEGLDLPGMYVRQTLLNFAPRNAYDFVWLPSIAWAPDGKLLIATLHGTPLGSEPPEDSPVFNLTAFLPEEGFSAVLVEQVGLWSSPQFSPSEPTRGLENVSLAYLQALNPLDSVVSRYQLVIADRDGSNRRTVFPPADRPGLQPQAFAWSPDGRQIALIYQGNLHLVDVVTGLAQQVTGDGLSSNPRWAP